jgi:choline dehydrogenase-like flavoprotein
MQIEVLSSVADGAVINADLLIIGGGPAGLTVAREFIGSPLRVLVVESGELEENPRFDALNSVEKAGEHWTEAQKRKRIEFHGANAGLWSHDSQSYGVRCRALGGSTHAWAGKSAAFGEIDFRQRPWVPNSGWPFSLDHLSPYLDRAAEILNLGPNRYDDSLWDLIGIKPPTPALDPELLRPFFWQFARSRIDQFDLMRFGSEFMTLDAPNVRVLTNATVTRIDTDPQGTAFESVEVSTIDGRRSRIFARTAVLAASGIENPRLLLVSNTVHASGLGNQHDLVGRYLMDHPGARIGRFDARDCPAVVKRFGFYGVRHNGRAHMYMHGLTLSDELQEREKLLNCAVYMLEDRAPDDPWDALKRLLRAKTNKPVSDILAVAKSPGLLAKGAGMRVFESKAVPERVKQKIIDAMIRINPNSVVREFQNRGLPHKLTGLGVDAITEQRPNPENRITLSDKCDVLGVRRPCANWQIDEEALRSLVRLGKLMVTEFPKIGLPPPVLEDWVLDSRPEDSVVIDMAHILGTTRMSENPKSGVVDRDCRVHGISGLYIAGGSVFPTSGHANPTLMILALAIRLADKIKGNLSAQLAN